NSLAAQLLLPFYFFLPPVASFPGRSPCSLSVSSHGRWSPAAPSSLELPRRLPPPSTLPHELLSWRPRSSLSPRLPPATPWPRAPPALPLPVGRAGLAPCGSLSTRAAAELAASPPRRRRLSPTPAPARASHHAGDHLCASSAARTHLAVDLHQQLQWAPPSSSRCGLLAAALLVAGSAPTCRAPHQPPLPPARRPSSLLLGPSASPSQLSCYRCSASASPCRCPSLCCAP
ncbi:hypothetical protein BRADI_4g35552v3, partial [Brachypodium distachyon]